MWLPCKAASMSSLFDCACQHTSMLQPARHGMHAAVQAAFGLELRDGHSGHGVCNISFAHAHGSRMMHPVQLSLCASSIGGLKLP